MKSSTGQLRIEYQNGHNYEPDFVVENNNEFLLLEPKKASELEDSEVIAKARAAIRWCYYENDHTTQSSGKHRRYALIPHDAIYVSMTAKGLADKYEFQS